MEKEKKPEKLEAEAQNLETVGWGKLKEAIVGSEAEGVYGLLRGVTSYSFYFSSQPPPSQPHISPGFPCSPNGPLRSPQNPKFQVLQAKPLCLLSQLPLQLPRVTYWLICNPPRIQLGAPRECISAGLKAAVRAHQPHGQPSVPILGEYT